MRPKSKFSCKLDGPSFLHFFHRKRFLFDVFFEFKHSKSFFSQHTYQRIIRVWVKKNLSEVAFLPTKEFDLSLTLHSFWVPKAENRFACIIFISDRSDMLCITSSWVGDSSPAVETEISSVLKSFLFCWSVELVVENAGLVLRLESHGHCFFVETDRYWSDLAAPFCSWVIRLGFLFFTRVVDYSMVPR